MEDKHSQLKITYLFAGDRAWLLEAVRKGEMHGAGFWGMCHLAPYGITAESLDPEKVYPAWLAKKLRKIFSSYSIHLTVFWKFFSYDIVFTSTGFGTQLFFTLLKQIGIPTPKWVMHDFNITGFLGDEKTLKQKIFAYLVAHADGIVTLSEREKEILEERFPHLASNGKIVFIPFGTDPKFFVPHDNEAGEKLQILAVGTDPDRDYKTLFRACEGLNIPVTVTTLSSRIDILKPLPEFVTLKRFSARELVEEYNRSAMVVIPLDTSRGLNDAMGSSTVSEALMMGKAIIATRTFTMESYIIHGETGLLADEGSAEDLREKILMLWNDAPLRKRLGENAREFAVKNSDIHIFSKRLAEFFKETILK